MREIVPGLGKLGILFDIAYPASAREADNVQTSARQLGLAVTPAGVQKADDIAPAFGAFKGQVDAVYLVEAALLDSNRTRVIPLALDAKLPMTVATREWAKAGALVSYGPNYPDLFRRAAVHGIDAAEKVVVRKQLRRGQMLAFFTALPPCLVGMEACATSHYWARELTKLGHQVRLMPAKDVKAYVKRNKNDAADAEAICEAVRRPTMRFVQIKSVEQQGQLMLHRARDLLMRQRTQLINALRAHMAELGIVAAQGREGVKELVKIIASEQDARLPVDAHASLVVLAAGLQALQTMIGSIERRIIAQHRSDEASKRLRSIPGIGIVGATAIAATVPDPKVFRSGRDFAAWIGIVPREDSTGGKQKLGPISKRGDQYLRRILVVGAHAVLKRARHQPEKYPWVTRLLERKPFRVVAVAVANKMARIAWALLARGGSYRAPALAAAA